MIAHQGLSASDTSVCGSDEIISAQSWALEYVSSYFNIAKIISRGHLK